MEYHVSAEGSPSGDGSEGRPWDLSTALRAPVNVQPGDVVWMHGGEYLPDLAEAGTPGPVAYVSRLEGSETAPVIVRAAPGERVTIDSRLLSESGLRGYYILDIGGSHTWWWGLEIRDSSRVRWTDVPGTLSAPRGAGIYSIRPGTKIINCVVHDTGTGIFESGATGAELYGNIVCHTGWNAPDRPHGPGFYIRNRSDPEKRKYLRDNIVMLTGRHGWQAFGSEGNTGSYFTVEGNVWIRNGEMFGQLVRGIQVAPTSRVFGTEIRENFSWFSPGFGNHRVEADSEGLIAEANRFAGRIALQLRTPLINATIRGNRFYGPTQTGSGSGFTDTAFEGNRYGPGEGVEVFVRRNDYEPDRFTVVVFNWAHDSSVSVDLSGFSVRDGDVLRVVSIEDLFTEPERFIYRNGLDLPLTGWSVAAPAGMAAFRSSLPEFGVFLVWVERRRLLDPGAGLDDRAARKSARLAAWRRPDWQLERDRQRRERSEDWLSRIPTGERA